MNNIQSLVRYYRAPKYTGTILRGLGQKLRTKIYRYICNNSVLDQHKTLYCHSDTIKKSDMFLLRQNICNKLNRQTFLLIVENKNIQELILKQ